MIYRVKSTDTGIVREFTTKGARNEFLKRNPLYELLTRAENIKFQEYYKNFKGCRKKEEIT